MKRIILGIVLALLYTALLVFMLSLVFERRDWNGVRWYVTITEAIIIYCISGLLIWSGKKSLRKA